MSVVINEDFGMYYTGTYVQTDKGKTVRIIGADTSTKLVHVSDGKSREELPVSALSFTQPHLGFKKVGKTVAYISRVPHRTTKKCVRSDVLSLFYPQEDEFNYMNKRLPEFDIYNVFKEEYTPIGGLDTALEKTDAVAITRFFAVVKKGFSEKPMLYYRESIVAEYDGNGQFTPIEFCEIFLDKLTRELEDVRN